MDCYKILSMDWLSFSWFLSWQAVGYIYNYIYIYTFVYAYFPDTVPINWGLPMRRQGQGFANLEELNPTQPKKYSSIDLR